MSLKKRNQRDDSVFSIWHIWTNMRTYIFVFVYKYTHIHIYSYSKAYLCIIINSHLVVSWTAAHLLPYCIDMLLIILYDKTLICQTDLSPTVHVCVYRTSLNFNLLKKCQSGSHWGLDIRLWKKLILMFSRNVEKVELKCWLIDFHFFLRIAGIQTNLSSSYLTTCF